MRRPAMRELDCPLCGGHEHREELVKEGFRHVRCARCHFVFVNPQPADDEAVNARLYGSDHPTWSGLADRLEGLDPDRLEEYVRRVSAAQPRRYLRDLQALERFRSTGRLLDIGCSAGFFLLAARERGWQVRGVDVAERSAAIGRRFFDLDIHVGGLSEGLYPDAHFDVVRANQVVEHLQSPRAFLETATRFLRPGGCLLLATINFRSATRVYLGARWRHLGDGRQGHVSFFEPGTMRRLLEELGYEQIEMRTIGFRLENPRGERARLPRAIEKLVGGLAGPLGWGGRLKVRAVRKPAS